MNALDSSYINDKRQLKEFKGLTFSGYKKSAVCNALIKSINENKIEEALNWTGELICAGYIKDLWETLILILGKHIHLASPKLVIYTHKKYELFRQIINNSEIVNSELELRNDSNFRKLFTEIVAVYCLSTKRPCLQKIVIKNNEFNLNEMGSMFDAPSIIYGEKVFKKTDPKEVFVPINEFAYHLSNKNMLKCIYWLEWLISFDQERRKKKNSLKCVNRTFVNVADIYETDTIWLIWECLLETSKTNPFLKKLLHCLLDLFCIRYSFSVKSKRRYLLYFAIELLTDNINTKSMLINEKEKRMIAKIVQETNAIYKIIKKNEIQPQCSYLLNSIPGVKTEKEKSINKFEKIFEISGNF